MLRRFTPRLFLAASSTRFCAKETNNNSTKQQESEASQEKETGGTENAIESRKSAGLDPSNDPVVEYARAALTREGREHIIEAPIVGEDSSYAPILSRGKKNEFEITSDIPEHVVPQHDWMLYQQREYFDMARQRKNPWRRMADISASFAFLGMFCGVITVCTIWLSQPKEVQEMREEILSHAYGRVLELGAGHGQNVGQYPYAVHEIVMMDQSAQLLNQIRYRLPKTAYPKYEIRHGKVEVLNEVPDASFDCVVDMFGMCHYKDPVGTLRQMQRVVKPTGTLLLLEHGRSPYAPVNWFLDYFSDRHAVNTHGCSWNRPMYEYFQESRLQVKTLQNKHFGTTWYLIGYPENLDALKDQLAKQNLVEAA